MPGRGSSKKTDVSSQNRILLPRMQKKLVVLFMTVLLAFAFLIIRLYVINRDNGEEYKKQVLSQQAYDSRELPFKRGTITDSKGTVLAASELVYNVIIDSFQMNSGDKDDRGESEFIEPSLDAAEKLGADREFLAQYVREHPENRYYVARKYLPYTEYRAYLNEREEASQRVANLRDAIREEENGDNNENRLAALQTQLEDARNVWNTTYAKVQGIWFEPAYIRSYPLKTMASDLIGFANNNNVGSFGLEGYYDSTLNGSPGREYGYLNDTQSLERTTIAARDGNNLVLTLDANIQSIIEKYLQEFNETYQNRVHEGYGARNVGCIMMDVTNGDILGMASYPNYDLSNPYDMSRIVGMPKLNERDAPTYEYMSQADVEALTDDEQKSRYLNALWRNFCISEYYEPGSVAKAFTLAAGLESGKMTGNEVYHCDGSLWVGGWEIKCHNTKGDGDLTVDQAIERSCNVALMLMASQTGIQDFTKFQRIFNFGLKTNIDLADEARTDLLLYKPENMGVTDLATNSFGQNFDITMIQGITAFSALVNGGNYWEPHVVKKITSASGSTVRQIEPRLIKRIVSETTSAKVREATLAVVAGAAGTGHTARPAGYMIGGKTGTAETIPRDHKNYVVSFMGYAPADNPKVAIYVVVDRPNAYPQDDAKYATRIVRKVLTEVLPYLGIYMTEELTPAEEKELAQMNLANTLAYGAINSADIPRSIRNNLDTNGDGLVDAVDGDGNRTPDTPVDSSGDGITDAVDCDGDGMADRYDTDNDGYCDSDTPPEGQIDQTRNGVGRINAVWRTYSVDPSTGYYIDPVTGNLVDDATGHLFGDQTMGEEEAAAADAQEQQNEQERAEELSDQTDGYNHLDAEEAMSAFDRVATGDGVTFVDSDVTSGSVTPVSGVPQVETPHAETETVPAEGAGTEQETRPAEGAGTEQETGPAAQTESGETAEQADG